MTIKIEKGTGERDKQTGKQRKGQTDRNGMAEHKANC
jgi:hypothetical protein